MHGNAVPEHGSMKIGELIIAKLFDFTAGTYVPVPSKLATFT